MAQLCSCGAMGSRFVACNGLYHKSLVGREKIDQYREILSVSIPHHRASGEAAETGHGGTHPQGETKGVDGAKCISQRRVVFQLTNPGMQCSSLLLRCVYY